jgi:hypothetical protein
LARLRVRALCNTSNLFARQLFVAGFNGTACQMLGAGALNTEPCSGPYVPRLKVDLQGRPVLVSAQGAGGRTMQLRRFEGGK